jgi:threonine/homoserine/homoserine lactone efflux protein
VVAVPAPSTLVLFAAAAMVLFVVPGPSVLYIVTRSIDQGRRAGFASVLGIHAGSLVHVAAAILGLSALLASSATAFAVVRYAGAAYLIWLGVRRLRDRSSTVEDDGAPPVPLSRVFAQGFVVNVFNPKTAIFFLAFLPQFVDAGAGPVPLQLAVFGVLFVLLGLLSDGTYAMVASAVGPRLARGRRFERAHRWGAGLVYLGLGLAAVFSGSRSRPA